MKRMHTLPWLAAAALALTLPLAAVAADEAPSAPDTPAVSAPAGNADGLSGVRVGKDPRSGKLRKTTAAEDAAMVEQVREFWAQFPRHEAKKDRKSGLTSLVVAPHSITLTVATRDADGHPAWDCVEQPEQMPAKIQQLSERSSQREER